MKARDLLLFVFVCASVHAATSDILMARGGSTFTGTAGNVVFNGSHFITPVVQSNGAVQLNFLDTKGVVVSNVSLSLTGSGPRLVLSGNDYLLAWLNTNVSPSELSCARVTDAIVGTVSTIATNVADETLSISGAGAQFLAVWQSAGSSSAVFARKLDSSGAPLASAFAVAPSVQPQLYPSAGTDGTNHLVCWVEQNVASNDWRTVAQMISNGLPAGVPVAVSQTNSLLPHPTACSFGSNYLVAWSADEIGRPYPPTNHFSSIQGRMVSPAGVPLSNAFAIARNLTVNTNPAIAFGDGSFLVAWSTGEGLYQHHQRVQRLSVDGSRHGYPAHTVFRFLDSSNRPRVGFAGGRFCVLYWFSVRNPIRQELTDSIVLGRDEMAAPALVNLRRTTNGGIAVDNSSPAAAIEVSTNLVNWTPSLLAQLPTLSGLSRLFVRSFDRKWQCIEQLRAVDWAKQQWAFDTKTVNSDLPRDGDLFGPSRYLRDKPFCPHDGTYSLQVVGQKPVCSLSGVGHTL